MISTRRPTAPSCKPPFFVSVPEISISDRLKDMLISSVACGDEILAGKITQNFTIIQCLARLDSCSTQDVQLLRIQVALAEFAMDAARGQIDQIKVRADGTGETHFKGTNYKDAEAMKRSQGTSVFTSRANSQNNFARTSKAREFSLSTSRASADGEFQNTGTDRSRRQQNNTTTTFDKAKTVGEGEGKGSSGSLSERSSYARTGTAPNPSPVAYGVIPTPGFLLTVVPLVTYPTLEYKTIGLVPTEPFDPFCAPDDLDPNDPPDELCEDIRPSVGAGFRSTFRGNHSFTVGIAIPLVGGVSLSAGYDLSWSNSSHFRNQMVCSIGGGKVEAGSHASINYFQNDDTTTSGETHTQGTGFDQRNVARNGTSLRTSTSRLHATSTGSMDSCGESHSFSRRKAHGEAQNTGESSSMMERHGETRTVFQSISKLIAEARYFNQIFKQLADLRRLLWEDLLRVEMRARASRPVMSSCARPRVLTAPPLFWFSNALTCSGCYGRAGVSGCSSCSGR